MILITFIFLTLIFLCKFVEEKEYETILLGEGGRVNKMVIDPVDNNIVWLVGDNSGVFKSIDGGNTWKSKNNNGLHNYALSDLQIDPVDHNTIWVASLAGPFKSIDGAPPFNEFKQSKPEEKSYSRLSTINIYPKNNQIIYVGVGSSGKYRTAQNPLYIGFKTFDGGKTWSTLGDSGGPTKDNIVISNIKFDSEDPNIVYLGSNQGLFKSTNAGDSWVQLTNNINSKPVNRIETYPNKLNCLIVATGPWAGAVGTGGMYYSDNGGNTFSLITNSYYSTNTWQWFKTIDDHGNHIIATGGNRVLITKNRGGTWENIGKPGLTHFGVPTYGVAAVKGNPNLIFAYASSFLKSTDAGKTWEKKYCINNTKGEYTNTGFVNTVVTRTFIDPTKKGHIYYTELDNGLIESHDYGVYGHAHINRMKELFPSISPSDCSWIDMDRNNNLYVLCGSMGGSANKNALFKKIDDNNWEEIQFFQDAHMGKLFIYEYNGIEKFFVCLWSLGLFYASVDSSQGEEIKSSTSWNQIDIANSKANFVIQSHFDKSILYAGFGYTGGYYGGFFKSTNFGESWVQIHYKGNIDGAFRNVHSFALHPTDEKVYVVGCAGYQTPGQGGVYLTKDGGNSFNRIDEGIKLQHEDIGSSQKRTAKTLTFNKDGSRLYVGYYDVSADYSWDKGAHYSDNYLSKIDDIVFTKINISHGIVYDINIDYEEDIIYISTGGNGVIRIKEKENHHKTIPEIIGEVFWASILILFILLFSNLIITSILGIFLFCKFQKKKKKFAASASNSGSGSEVLIMDDNDIDIKLEEKHN